MLNDKPYSYVARSGDVRGAAAVLHAGYVPGHISGRQMCYGITQNKRISERGRAKYREQ